MNKLMEFQEGCIALKKGLGLERLLSTGEIHRAELGFRLLGVTRWPWEPNANKQCLFSQSWSSDISNKSPDALRRSSCQTHHGRRHEEVPRQEGRQAHDEENDPHCIVPVAASGSRESSAKLISVFLHQEFNKMCFFFFPLFV